MEIIDLVIISILSVLLILVSSVGVLDKIKYRRLVQASVQLVLDKSAMSEEIDRLSFLTSNSDELNDGFVKFLSESRDMAFDYIAEVQSAIEQLKTSMELGDENSINQAYEHLISFLPTENQNMVD